MGRTRVRWGKAGALVAALSSAVILVGARAGAAASSSRRPEPGPVYVVRSGDTLWGIAQRRVGPREDPRPYVDRLVALNHLAGAAIRPGASLVLPG